MLLSIRALRAATDNTTTFLAPPGFRWRLYTNSLTRLNIMIMKRLKNASITPELAKGLVLKSSTTKAKKLPALTIAGSFLKFKVFTSSF